jgi:hypothetical protein
MVKKKATHDFNEESLYLRTMRPDRGVANPTLDSPAGEKWKILWVSIAMVMPRGS